MNNHSKRFKQEPYITQRQGKNGLWTFQVFIRTDYTTITKSFSEKTYGSARVAYDTAVAYKNRCLTDVLNNTILKASTITVQEIFDEFLENNDLSFNSLEKHRKIFNRYITTKDVPIQQLTKADIIGNLNAITSKASDDTIGRVYTIYKNDIILQALNKEYLNRDLMAGIKKPKSRVVKQKKSTVTDRETILEVERLLLASNSNKYNSKLIYYLMELMYYTGMRPAEAQALTRDDIKEDYIDINKQLGSDKESRHVVTNCKTPTSVRKVPIHPQLKPIIEELLDFSRTYEIFRREDGSYLDSDYVGTMIYHLLRKTDIEFNLYRLRHNMATTLVTNGTDSKTTMELLGHAQYNMSLGYANSSTELKDRAIKLLS